MSEKKPDNVVYNEEEGYNASLLPYSTNVSATVIKPDDVSLWKNEKVSKTNHYFKSRYEEIKEEYRKLIEMYEWNKLVYESKFSFTPIKGEIYHLYQRKSGELFLSIISPNEWNQIFVGTFQLDSNDKWIKINE